MTTSDINLYTIRNVMIPSAENALGDTSAPQLSAGEVPQQANSDKQAIRLWLHTKGSNHTKEAYTRDIIRFLKHMRKPLRQVRLQDLQCYADYLKEEELQPSSCRRMLSGIKSLFSFCMKIGYLRYDPAQLIQLPNFKNTLAEKILTEEEVLKIIAYENNPRNKMILKLLYATAARVSELCRLTWKDCRDSNLGANITIYGKGEKTHAVVIPKHLWEELQILKGNSTPDAPIFKSRKGGFLDRSQVLRIVKKAAKKAKIDKPISPHFFRHSHATHALQNGANLKLIQSQLNHSSIAISGVYLSINPQESSSSFLKI